MADKTKFCRPVHSTFEALVVQCAVGRCGKDWTRVFDDYQLQMLQFSMHLINLLSTLLRCDSFTTIRKAILDQMGSRPPNSDHHFLVQVWLGQVLWSVFSVQPVSCSSLLSC